MLAGGARGFGLVIFGAVLSTSQKDIISQNQIGDISTLNEELNNREDLLIMEGDTLSMGPYFVSYRDRYQEGIHVKFRMDYFEKAPHTYQPGDVVFFDGMVFEAKKRTKHRRNFRTTWKTTGCSSRSRMSAKPRQHSCGRRACLAIACLPWSRAFS